MNNDNKKLNESSRNEEIIDLYIDETDNSKTNISEAIKGSIELIKIVYESPEILKSFKDAISSIQKSIVNILSISTNISITVNDFSKKIGQLISEMAFPNISEEEKNSLIESHEKWGSYGWTCSPFAEGLLDVAPASKEEADKNAVKAYKDMDSVFEVIRMKNRVKKEDFEEAVYDFHSGKYKSCALILVSLIDAKLIRLQGNAKSERSNWRDTGSKAAKKAQNKAESKYQNKDKGLFTSLFFVNYFSCLAVVFETGKDFKEQPPVINRNFLSHGMMTRRVNKKDCIQLFLLYYNTLELLDMIY